MFQRASFQQFGQNGTAGGQHGPVRRESVPARVQHHVAESHVAQTENEMVFTVFLEKEIGTRYPR